MRVKQEGTAGGVADCVVSGMRSRDVFCPRPGVDADGQRVNVQRSTVDVLGPRSMRRRGSKSKRRGDSPVAKRRQNWQKIEEANDLTFVVRTARIYMFPNAESDVHRPLEVPPREWKTPLPAPGQSDLLQSWIR